MSSHSSKTYYLKIVRVFRDSGILYFKTSYLKIVGYSETVGFSTFNSSSVGFDNPNTKRGGKPKAYSSSLSLILVPIGVDGRSARRHDLIENDNQPHNESLVVARLHCQIEHISSQRYI